MAIIEEQVQHRDEEAVAPTPVGEERRRGAWGWLVVTLAVTVAVVALVAAFFPAGGVDGPSPEGVRPLLLENGSPRAVDAGAEAVPGAHDGLIDNGSVRAVEGTVEIGPSGDHDGLLDNGSIAAVEDAAGS
jgi:hypothetical protein